MQWCSSPCCELCHHQLLLLHVEPTSLTNQAPGCAGLGGLRMAMWFHINKSDQAGIWLCRASGRKSGFLPYKTDVVGTASSAAAFSQMRSDAFILGISPGHPSVSAKRPPAEDAAFSKAAPQNKRPCPSAEQRRDESQQVSIHPRSGSHSNFCT